MKSPGEVSETALEVGGHLSCLSDGGNYVRSRDSFNLFFEEYVIGRNKRLAKLRELIKKHKAR